MSNSRPHLLASKLAVLLRQLQAILVGEGEKNWIRGVEAAAAEISDAEHLSEDEVRERLQNAASIYRTMNGGYGSFSDFHIWRDDYDERIKANEPLDCLRAELWETVNAIQSIASGA